jgi:phosphoserine phosphatase
MAAGIVAFDLDGTLVTGTSVCIHLAPWVSHRDIEELESRYDAGIITNQQVADRDGSFYARRARADAYMQLETIPLISGISDTIEWLRAHQLVPMIATVTWSFAAEFLAERFGFAAAAGCKMAEEDGILLGTVARHFAPEDKATFVHDVAASEGVEMDRVVAVGDSQSDVPMFAAAGFGIALYAGEAAREAADIALDTDDLRDVIAPIERYLDSLDPEVKA